MRIPSCSLLFAALCATSTAAFAQSQSPATTLDRTIEDEHRRGMSLRAQHQDEAARAVFEALWSRTHEPRARARQALAEQSLSRFAEAEAHLVEALSFSQDPWITQNRALLEPVLQQARAAQGVAILHVRCETADAGVVIGGSEVGSVGSTLRVPPGRVSFEVRAEGFASVSRTVELAPGSVVRVDITLDRSAPATSAGDANDSPHANPNAPADSHANASAAPAAARPVLHPAVLTDLRPAPSPLRPIAWASAGLAVASVGVGAITLALGSSAAARWNSDACLRGALTREQSCPSELATAESMRAVSIAGWVGAGVFATTAAALFVLSRPRAESPRSVAVRCAPSLASLTCAGVF